MTIEPHDITTVSRRPPVGMDRPRTLADYQADLMHKLKVDKLPSLRALAARESRVMRRVTGHQENRAASTPHSPEASSRVTALRDAFDARKKSRNEAIVAYLSEDFRTSGDVATRFKVSIETAQEALRALKADGRVIMARVRRTAVWRAAGEKVAAE